MFVILAPFDNEQSDPFILPDSARIANFKSYVIIPFKNIIVEFSIIFNIPFFQKGGIFSKNMNFTHLQNIY